MNLTTYNLAKPDHFIHMKKLTLATIMIFYLMSCNNNNPPQRVYEDVVDGNCRGCGGNGYIIKECRCVRDPEGVGKQNSHYDMRDGEISDCIMCVSFGRALFADQGCNIGEIAEDCPHCDVKYR